MGRGKNLQIKGSLAPRTAGAGLRAFNKNILELDELVSKQQAEAARLEGSVLNYTSDRELILAASDPVLAMKGFSEISRANFLPGSKRWEITYTDGSVALVDLKNMQIASTQEPLSDERIAGAFAKALADSSLLRDPSSGAEKNLRNFYSAYSDNPTEDNFRKAMVSAQAVLEDKKKGIELQASDLQAAIAEYQPEEFDPRASAYDARFDMDPELQTRMNKAIQKGVNPALALVNRVDENGDPYAGIEDEKEMFWEAAKIMCKGDEEKARQLIPKSNIHFAYKPKRDENGDIIYVTDDKGNKVPVVDEEGNEVVDEITGETQYEYEIEIDPETGEGIPESVGSFYAGREEQRRFHIIQNAADAQARSFVALGRPGAGKNATEKEYAAIIGAPYHEFIFNGTTDLQSLIGGDALAAREFTDENGNVVGGAAQSVVSEGPIARAFAQPGVTSFQEVIELKNEFTIFNGAAGSYVGEPDQRFVTISSSMGDFTYPVHKDHYIFSSFNQGAQDERMMESFHERSINLVYDLPTTEEMSKRMAVQVSKAMKAQKAAPELRRDFSAEEIRPFVEILENLNTAYEDDNEQMVMAPGPRVINNIVPQLLLSAYNNQPNPIRNMRETLHYCLDTNSTTEERDDFLIKMMTEQETALKDLMNAARAANPEFSEE